MREPSCSICKSSECRRVSRAALKIVNDAREALGLRRIEQWFKGFRREACECPVAVALDDGKGVLSPLVNYVQITFRGNGAAAEIVADAWGRCVHDGEFAHEAIVLLPVVVKQFVGLFDNGHYPELVRKAVAA